MKQFLGDLGKAGYLSARISSRTAPSRAVQPRDSFCISGAECRKKKVITNTSVTADLTSSTLFLIGYCGREQWILEDHGALSESQRSTLFFSSSRVVLYSTGTEPLTSFFFSDRDSLLTFLSSVSRTRSSSLE